jgi:hypothetical protein
MPCYLLVSALLACFPTRRPSSMRLISSVPPGAENRGREGGRRHKGGRDAAEDEKQGPGRARRGVCVCVCGRYSEAPFPRPLDRTSSQGCMLRRELFPGGFCEPGSPRGRGRYRRQPVGQGTCLSGSELCHLQPNPTAWPGDERVRMPDAANGNGGGDRNFGETSVSRPSRARTSYTPEASSCTPSWVGKSNNLSRRRDPRGCKVSTGLVMSVPTVAFEKVVVA